MKRTILALIFLMIVSQVSATIELIPRYEDQNVFYYSEDLLFMSCESLDYQHAISCRNGKDLVLDTTVWNRECLISSINLEEINCPSAVIKVLDGQKLIDSYPISIKKLVPIKESVIMTQNDDGSWDTASETAYNIWILYQFNNTYQDELQKGLDWLKKVRLNDNKCWIEPYSDVMECSLRETAKVLAYLKLAGFDEALRVVHDGQAWLNTQQNFIEDNQWTLQVASNQNSNCTLGYDSKKKFDIAEDEEKTFLITPVARKKINLTCEDTVWAMLMESDGRVVFDYYDSEFRYTINGGCWNGDAWETCDYKSSLYATIATINEERKTAGREYLKSILVKDKIIGKYLPSNDRIVDSALYLNYIDYDTSVRSFLVFNQNNDGSWSDPNSTSDTALETIYPTFAFIGQNFKPNQETTADALEWLRKNTPFNGWRNIEKDTLNYLLLNNTIPQFISSEPKILYFNNTNTVVVELINPTDYVFNEINYTSAGKAGINQNISLGAQDKKNITIIQKEKQDGLHFDVIKFFFENKTLKKIPVIIQNNPHIKINYPKKIYVINDSRNIKFSVDKSASQFVCDLHSKLNILTLRNNIVDSNIINVNVKIGDTARRTIEYKGMLDCKSELLSTSFPINIVIEQYEEWPLEAIDEVKITKRSQVRKLKFVNKINDSISVKVGFETPMAFHSFEENVFELEGYGKKKIKINQNVPTGINYSIENKIIVTALENDVSIPIEIKLTDDDFSSQGQLGIVGTILKYIVIFLVICGIGFGGYIGYKKIMKIQKIKKEKKEVRVDVEKIGNQEVMDKETIELIRVIDKLNKSLNKDDKSLREQLKSKGFSDDKIDYALETIRKG